MLTELHPTVHILDSSKLEDYKRCPRRFFYRHVLGWTPNGGSNHLKFGTAWHKAMEKMLELGQKERGYTANVLAEAYLALEEEYRRYFPPETDSLYFPKTPGNAQIALVQYAHQYASDFGSNQFGEVLDLEVAGTAPISETRHLHFRIDCVKRDKNGICVMDHKTASRHDQNFERKFELSSQMFAYMHVIVCLHNPKDVFGAIINAAFFQKSDVKFARLPIRCNIAMLQAWLQYVNRWFDMLEWDLDTLQEEMQNPTDTMTSFALNDQGCSMYGGCVYHDFCVSWPNPLLRCDDVPIGYMQEYWNPLDEQKDAKKVVEL